MPSIAADVAGTHKDSQLGRQAHTEAPADVLDDVSERSLALAGEGVPGVISPCEDRVTALREGAEVASRVLMWVGCLGRART